MEWRRTRASFIFYLEITQRRSADANEGMWHATDDQVRVNSQRPPETEAGGETIQQIKVAAADPTGKPVPGRSAMQQE